MLRTGMLQSMSNVTHVFLQTLQMLQTCYEREFPNVTNRYKSLQIVTTPGCYQGFFSRIVLTFEQT